MHTAITGATGLVGGNLAAELHQQGHTVTAIRRASSKTGHLDHLPIHWVDADLNGEEGLKRAFMGADVVFHCAAQVSIRRTIDESMRQANVEGTRRVLAAAHAVGVPRVVHCSTVGAIGLTENGQPCDETATWNFDKHGMDDAYATTKHLAEEVVRAAVGAGQDVVIVNPTYMFGPYDVKPSSGKLIVDVVDGRVPGYTTGINNFVDVRDVARGMIRAAERGKTGERYILGGEEMTYKAVMERIAAVAGVAPPSLPAPRFLAKLMGWGGDLQEKLSTTEPLLNSVTIDYAYCTTFRFASEKASRELGYTTGPLDDAIRDALAWFRAHGMVRR